MDAKVPRYSNILCAKLYASLVAVQQTQPFSIDVHNFIDNLNNNYLLHNHIHHHSSQHNYLYKLLIATILFHVQHTKRKVTIQIVKAMLAWSMGKNEANKLVKQGSIRDPIPLNLTPFHLIGHWIPTSTQHNGSICNIKRYIENKYCGDTISSLANSYPYVSKWLYNEYIQQTWSNLF